MVSGLGSCAGSRESGISDSGIFGFSAVYRFCRIRNKKEKKGDGGVSARDGNHGNLFPFLAYQRTAYQIRMCISVAVSGNHLGLSLPEGHTLSRPI